MRTTDALKIINGDYASYAVYAYTLPDNEIEEFFRFDTHEQAKEFVSKVINFDAKISYSHSRGVRITTQTGGKTSGAELILRIEDIYDKYDIDGWDHSYAPRLVDSKKEGDEFKKVQALNEEIKAMRTERGLTNY